MAVWRDLDELKLWERNYNKGDTQQIKKSILRFGFNNALRVWRESTIMAGNHSTIALRECLADGWTATEDGIKLANGKLLRGGAVQVVDGRVQVDTVDLAHLPKSEAEAFAIADNHIASKAEPDEELLAGLLQELALDDINILDDIGYSEESLQLMLEDIADGLVESDPLKGMIPDGNRYKEQYGCIVICANEAHQQEVFDKLASMGYEVRVVVT